MEEIIRLFLDKQYRLDMGKGSLSKDFSRILERRVTEDEIKEGKKIAKGRLKYGKNYYDKRKQLPKILLFDIETAPSISYTFGRFNYNIAYNQVEQEPFMLTWAAKWLYSTEYMSDKVTPEESLMADDSRIVKSLWELVAQADIIIAHFGDKFDVPMLNTRAILGGLPPYTPVRTIDTYKVSKTNFKFPSNKLDALAMYFGIPGKIETNFQLWIDCIKGKENSIDAMEIYNIQDIEVLEAVYLKLRPWIKSHPNLGVYMNKQVRVCSACASEDITETDTYQYTNTGMFKIWRCKCGALTRGRRTDFDKTKKKILLTSVPR